MLKSLIKLLALLSVVGMMACSDLPSDPSLEVYLVRHAEKTTEKTDPGLTEAGQRRAELLAEKLDDAQIERIHSSDYIRTRDTAAPLAKLLGIEIELYDPRDLPAIAAQLEAEGGTHLVVGHSNTTPQLVELLGGDGGEPIVEATEYDRLYIVRHKSDDNITSELQRFGAK